MAQPRIGLEGGEEGLGTGEFPRLVVHGEYDLQGECGEVGRRQTEQPAKGGEAGAFEVVEAVLERLRSWKGAAFRGEGVDLPAIVGEARFCEAISGDGAGPRH